jgi:sucrose-phosphate synthase
MISIHGLLRGRDLELGRDADTGGQIRYVVELARALGSRDDVARVDLITRRIDDPSVSDDYGRPVEALGDTAQIVRLPAGPPEYLPKESLWPHLDELVQALVDHLRAQPRLPDVLHSHYADAGYVGAQVSRRLGIPLVHTGHSLGKVKAERLRARGWSDEQLEEQLAMSTRVAAEEQALQRASMVVVSTHQECDEQWSAYEHHASRRCCVIPPGTDLQRLHPPDGTEWRSETAAQIDRFLTDPHRPMVLVLARPDRRKNLVAQVEAFAEDEVLRQRANLVVVAGTRDDIEELPGAAEQVLTDILLVIDRHDLYGRVAYPKDLSGDDIPRLYRLAAATRGVHVNAALTEPFGLTLLEAAASGLPVVATAHGGPADIVPTLGHGVLVDPLDKRDIARGIRQVLFDGEAWLRHALAGVEGVRAHYSWTAHAAAFVDALERRVLHPLPRTGTGG